MSRYLSDNCHSVKYCKSPKLLLSEQILQLHFFHAAEEKDELNKKYIFVYDKPKVNIALVILSTSNISTLIKKTKNLKSIQCLCYILEIAFPLATYDKFTACSCEMILKGL